MAKGYTNGQIAEALGITLDGAKFHVSEIFSRLHVGSREEAVATWRESQRPLTRLRGFAGLLSGKLAFWTAAATTGTAVLFVGVLALASALHDGDEPQQSLVPDRSNVTVEEVLDAMRPTGKVVHLQMEGAANGQHIIMRGWHSADERATRIESEVDGVLRRVEVDLPERKAVFFPEENSLADGPLDPAEPGAPDATYESFPHLAALLKADDVQFRGTETLDGVRVVRLDSVDVRTKDEVYEEPVGTTNRASIYLRNDDLLPVRMEFSTMRPGQNTFDFVYEVTTAEYLDPASLPPGLFDPDTLAADRIDTNEALEVAARQPFETHWLGARLEVAWQTPDGRGSDHQEVVMVSAPGVPGSNPGDPTIRLGYGPPGLSLTLVDIRQGPLGSFEPLPPDRLAAMEAGGNLTRMEDGEGYFYVEYFPRGTCDFDAAQRDRGCRLGTGRYGAVLERDGTLVHIASAPKYDGTDESKDTNPFSSPEAVRDLVGRLQPIP
jgi:hypothetical protein